MQTRTRLAHFIEEEMYQLRVKLAQLGILLCCLALASIRRETRLWTKQGVQQSA